MKVMAEIKFPVFELEKEKFQVTVDTRLYQKAVITAAIYKLSHLFYIHQSIDTIDANIINIIFENKDGNTVENIVPKQFCNELIDQQIRYDTEQKFGKIRDMIVEEAFKPITK